MLEQIQETEEKRVQEIYIKLIKYYFNRKDAKQIDAINTATQRNEILNKHFAPWFEAIELNSTQAEEAKKEYLRINSYKSKKDQKTSLNPSNPSPQERLQICLEKFENNYHLAWWDITRVLTLKPNNLYYEQFQFFKTDLTILAGWQAADIQTRKRIVEAAKKYIINYNPGHLKFIQDLLKAYVLYNFYFYKIILWQKFNAARQILEIVCQIINKNINQITTYEIDYLELIRKVNIKKQPSQGGVSQRN